jgi:hypothetical protein
MNETMGGQESIHSLAETRPLGALAKRQVIVVLGMHRSGTSAIAGVISALGVAGPRTMSKPDDWNPHGYFESTLFFVAFDEMLAAAGSAWDDWRQLNLQWLHSKAAEHHRQTIKRLLINELGEEPLIFVKDPRICRFVPFMTSIFADLNLSPVAILPLRNPLEVAYSLKRRDKFSLPKSTLLWLRHVLDAEFHSRHMPRCFLPYREFLIDWRYFVGRVVEKTGLIWPNCPGGADVKIDEFLSSELCHERASSDEIDNRPEVAPLVRETYNILKGIAADGEGQQMLDQLDRIRTRFDEACQMFGPMLEAEKLAMADSTLLAQRDNLAAGYGKLLAERDVLTAAHDRLIAEHDSLIAAHNRLIAEQCR